MEDSIEQADLSEYDLSKFKATKFEFAATDWRHNKRQPASFLEAVKKKAKGLPYQRYIRAELEKAVGKNRKVRFTVIPSKKEFAQVLCMV